MSARCPICHLPAESSCHACPDCQRRRVRRLEDNQEDSRLAVMTNVRRPTPDEDLRRVVLGTGRTGYENRGTRIVRKPETMTG